MRKNKASGLIVVIGVLVLCLVFLLVFNPKKNTSDDRGSEGIDEEVITEEDTTDYKAPYTETEYDSDPEENSIVEEDTEATTETKEKKSGGRLLPASDDANDSDSGSTGKKKSTSATTEFDPDDHDIESYYEDNIDEFDSIDDAYDAFEDDEEAWDDY